MYKKCIFLLYGLLLKMSLGEIFEIDDSLNPMEINQNQLYINKKERFIKFDSDDNELKVEVGISVPFINVPLITGRDMYEGKKLPPVKINAPGAIIAGMLMITSFLIIPFLFSTGPSHGFSFQRRDDENYWEVLKNIDDALSRNGIDFSSCFQKSICWMSKTLKNSERGSVGEWINYMFSSWWFKRLVSGTMVEESLKTDLDVKYCEVKYANCSLNARHLLFLTEILNAGHGPIAQ